MRYLRPFLAPVLLSMLPFNPTMAGQPSSPWYVGGGFGSAQTSIGSAALTESLRDAGHAGITATVDDKANSLALHGGYQYLPQVSFEAGLWANGPYDVAISLTTN